VIIGERFEGQVTVLAMLRVGVIEGKDFTINGLEIAPRHKIFE